jgi:hypothetical protein
MTILSGHQSLLNFAHEALSVGGVAVTAVLLLVDVAGAAALGYISKSL